MNGKLLISLAGRMKVLLLGLVLLAAPMSWAGECDPECDSVGAIEHALETGDVDDEHGAGEEGACTYSCGACHFHMIGHEVLAEGEAAPPARVHPATDFVRVVLSPDSLFRPPRV